VDPLKYGAFSCDDHELLVKKSARPVPGAHDGSRLFLHTRFLLWVAASSLGCAFAQAGAADPIEALYHGKRIEFVIGYTPGGLYDIFGRLVAQFMVVPRNMPGGSSRGAVGFLARVAPQDGTTLVVASRLGSRTGTRRQAPVRPGKDELHR
jgi:hypothetical protein